MWIVDLFVHSLSAIASLQSKMCLQEIIRVKPIQKVAEKAFGIVPELNKTDPMDPVEDVSNVSFIHSRYSKALDSLVLNSTW